MASEASGKLFLSTTLQQTTTALSRLDTAALARLIERLDAVRSGSLEVQHEPVEEIRVHHKLLGSVLAATEKNMKILNRFQQRKGTTRWVP